jgi:integrase
MSSLATGKRVAASTQNQSLAALLLNYRNVLGIELGWPDHYVRAKRLVRIPHVLSRAEVSQNAIFMRGTGWLLTSHFYGAGLSLLEACRIRVQDVEFERRQLVFRGGKGWEDRVALLPEPVGPLFDIIWPLSDASTSVTSPSALAVLNFPTPLERKYPHAPWEWGWQ